VYLEFIFEIADFVGLFDIFLGDLHHIHLSLELVLELPLKFLHVFLHLEEGRGITIEY
jgi:hypothetical protein